MVANVSAACLLTEGVGGDFGKIGITRRANQGKVPPGVELDYGSEVLAGMWVVSGECRTSKNIRIGSPQTEVERAYGKGKKFKTYLMKGKSDNIGQLGDYVLAYPGVSFVMYKGSVAFMRISAIARKKSQP